MATGATEVKRRTRDLCRQKRVFMTMPATLCTKEPLGTSKLSMGSRDNNAGRYRVPGIPNCRRHAFEAQLAFDAHLLACKVDLDLGAAVHSLYGSGYASNATAAAHSFNLKLVHIFTFRISET